MAEYRGILNRIVHRGSYHKENALSPIVSHKDTDVIPITKIEMEMPSGKGRFYFDFYGCIPNEYVGKEITFEESFHEKEEKVKEHKQKLSSKGLQTLVASMSFIA